jgi:endonuclease/exonuclease/phosphatase (EEP) superfamily protein YafD
MSLLFVFHTCLVGILFLTSLIPLLREQTWWLRAFTYARLQKLALVVVFLAIQLILFRWDSPADGVVLILLLLTGLICLRDILPFTAVGGKQVKKAARPEDPARTLKLLVGNVLMDNDDHAGLVDHIHRHDPDVVFLVETNEVWRGYLHAVERDYPYNWLLPLEDYNGMLLYSKLPLTNVTERRLVQDHIPSIRLKLELPDGQDVTFYGLHPRPPRPEDDTADLDKELLMVAEEVGDRTDPIIVTGDLNDVGWSSTTKRFLARSGLRDPRRGRGLYNSFHAKNPLVRWPLDHVFLSQHFDLVEMHRLSGFGSDHFPIYIELALKPQV